MVAHSHAWVLKVGWRFLVTAHPGSSHLSSLTSPGRQADPPHSFSQRLSAMLQAMAPVSLNIWVWKPSKK